MCWQGFDEMFDEKVTLKLELSVLSLPMDGLEDENALARNLALVDRRPGYNYRESGPYSASSPVVFG
jgi:hypothetical protein